MNPTTPLTAEATTDSDASLLPAIAISRSDRWQVYHRLRDLNIPAYCFPDGMLRADVSTPLAALQVRSVIYQITASRKDLVELLDRCWRVKG
ncbi:Asr1405/Asl0597 family protein [Leptolyngbya sp. O-77]|uniref:Asr1405/Asl0597 family protein n=1 Tax=Leptolyngbya sp. O-77 TaxID=1080068 RepID=UPI00074D3F79|nr:Asr1405/Asl0597 family protein [Leptolyngbya sp. O-77]BAU43804.1 hypothetical protein O77CONTIG1_03636 [Leptolyngbya sp. O-77]